MRRRAALAVGRVGLAEACPAHRACCSPTPIRSASDGGVRARADRRLRRRPRPDCRAQGPVAARAGAAPPRRSALDRRDKPHAAAIAAMVRPHVDAGVLRRLAPDDLTYPLAPAVEAVRLGLYALTRLKTYEPLASVVLDAAGSRCRSGGRSPTRSAASGIPEPRPALTALTRSGGVYTRAFAARGLGSCKSYRLGCRVDRRSPRMSRASRSWQSRRCGRSARCRPAQPRRCSSACCSGPASMPRSRSR